MVNIYVLELEGGKFYVGKTEHGLQRLKQHTSGQGSKWTKKHKPVDLHRWFPKQKDADENRVTLEMVKKFGAENVRGGNWTKVRMSKSELSSFQKRAGPRRKIATKKERTGTCSRCGRASHNRSKCYAWSTIDGVEITTKSWKYRPQNKTKPSKKKTTRKVANKKKIVFTNSSYTTDKYGRPRPKTAADYAKERSSTKKKTTAKKKKTTAKKKATTRKRATRRTTSRRKSK